MEGSNKEDLVTTEKHARIQNVLSEGVQLWSKYHYQRANICHQRNAIYMSFCLSADDGQKLIADFEA